MFILKIWYWIYSKNWPNVSNDDSEREYLGKD